MARLYTVAVILAVVMTASTLFSSVMVSRLDDIVHTKLYTFGLVFSQEWFTPYSQWLWYLNSLLLVAATLLGASLPLLLLPFMSHVFENEELRVVGILKVVAGLFLSLATVLLVLSVYFLTRVDYIVHHDLYNFGLVFSRDWAASYWQNLTVIRLLMMGAVGVGVGSIGGMLRARAPYEEFHLSLERMWLLPLGIGLAAIGIAFYLRIGLYVDLSILAIVGLGSVLSGLILRYLAEDRYTLKALLDAAVKSQIASMNQRLTDATLQDRVAVYLPAKYLPTWNENRVHLAPRLGEVLLMEDPQTMAPPGDEIVKILENHLHRSFVEVDLPFLEQNLPRLLTELEIAERIELQVRGDQIDVELQHCIYSEGARGLMNSSKAALSLGSPITSAIACILAKATGRPIVLSNEAINAESVTAKYTFLGDEMG